MGHREDLSYLLHVINPLQNSDLRQIEFFNVHNFPPARGASAASAQSHPLSPMPRTHGRRREPTPGRHLWLHTRSVACECLHSYKLIAHMRACTDMTTKMKYTQWKRFPQPKADYDAARLLRGKWTRRVEDIREAKGLERELGKLLPERC